MADNNKRKRIADGDFAVLARYDRQLHSLVYAKCLQGVGHNALEWMTAWWERYTGKKRIVYENCASCIADFLTDVGNTYFAEKTIRGAAAYKVPSPVKVKGTGTGNKSKGGKKA